MAKAKKTKKIKKKKTTNTNSTATVSFKIDTSFLDTKRYKDTGKSREWLESKFKEVVAIEMKRREKLYAKAQKDESFKEVFIDRCVRTLGTKLRKSMAGFTKPGFVMTIGVGDEVNYVKFWKAIQLKKYYRMKENNKQSQAIFKMGVNEPDTSIQKKVKKAFVKINKKTGKPYPIDIRKKFKSGAENEDGYGNPYPKSTYISNILVFFKPYDSELKDVKTGLYVITVGGEQDDSLTNPESDDYILESLREKAFTLYEGNLSIIRDENGKFVKLGWNNSTELKEIPKKYQKFAKKYDKLSKLEPFFRKFNKEEPKRGQHFTKCKDLNKAWAFTQTIKNKQDRRNYFWIIQGEVMSIQKRANDKQGRWNINVNEESMGFKDKEGKPIRGIRLTASANLFKTQIHKVFGEFSDIYAIGILNRYKLKDKNKKETDKWSTVSVDLWGIFSPELFREEPAPIPEDQLIQKEKPKKIEEPEEEVEKTEEIEEPEETESEDEEEYEEEDEEMDEATEKEIEEKLESLLEDEESEEGKDVEETEDEEEIWDDE